MTHLTDEDFEAAVKRLRAFKDQQEQSEQLADEGSLERAFDLAAVLEDQRWADDLPPIKISHRRGRLVDPYGKSRLARWVKEHIGFHYSYTYRLINTAAIAEELFRPGERIQNVTERSLRPLGRLLRQDRLDETPVVWEKAVRLAGGHTPSAEQVRAALREYDPPRRSSVDTKGSQRGIEFQILAEFRQLIKAGKYRTAGELINEMGSELKKAIKDAA
jgi:hypothetical protein